MTTSAQIPQDAPAAPAADCRRAQHGEDLLIARLCAEKRGGCFIEVGAFDGIDMSNTYYLARRLGWRGVLIEADPQLAEKCRGNRPESTVVNCAAVAPGGPAQIPFQRVVGIPAWNSISVSGAILQKYDQEGVTIETITVPARTLDSVLQDVPGLPAEVDVMTIDVEGHEFEVLQGFTPARWNPRHIVLERNSHFPEGRIMRYMHASGYEYFTTTGGVNDWFRKGRPNRFAYRLRLWCAFYLVKCLTLYRPAWQWTRALLKKMLRFTGLLHPLRRLFGRT